MANKFRSKFESMVFQTTAAHATSTTPNTPAAKTTHGSVYAWMQELHPSLMALDPDSSSTDTASAPTPFRPPPTIITHKKIDMEHLFEVVVMYLFNGLKAVPIGKGGKRDKDGTGGEETPPDTTSLLHYLAYITPEADKLHVIDLGAHSGYFQRMRHVRVLFDHTDFRFRVIVKTNESGAWVDICLKLRALFTDVITRLVPKESREINYCWEEVVKAFRVHLLDLLVHHTTQSVATVETWVMQHSDIAWETTTYAAGDVTVRDLVAETNTDPLPHKPFIISFWLDNYLELNLYKMARMFNGLVGYGEYLYSRDNNYCRKASNNFFVSKLGEKQWLWDDIAQENDSTADRPRNVVVANVNDRSDILEAVISNGKLHLTAGFRSMVARRQQLALTAVEDDVFKAIGETFFGTVSDPYTDLANYARSLLRDLFDMSSSSSSNDNNVFATRGDGLLDAHVLTTLCRMFTEKCYELQQASQQTTPLRATTLPDKAADTRHVQNDLLGHHEPPSSRGHAPYKLQKGRRRVGFTRRDCSEKQ